MYKKRLKNSYFFALDSGVGARTLSGDTLLDAGAGEAEKVLRAWGSSSHENAYVYSTCPDDLNGIASPQSFASPTHDSPQRAEWIGDEVYTHNDDIGISSVCTFHPSPQHVYTSTFMPSEGCRGYVYALNGLINSLPDELLCQIFSFLPSPRDRSVCASVSKRWLLLQSHMRRNEFVFVHATESSEEPGDEVQSREVSTNFAGKVLDNEKRVERQLQWAIGDLSRSLEGRKASDTRLAAVAVGTGARGGLGKLSIRKSFAREIGLSAIGSCCVALKSLCLWDCPYIQDEGLSVVGKGCGLLEKVDLFKCPLVGDRGLLSIAKNCPLLSFLSLDECGSITDKSLVAVGQGCLNLLTLSIRNCPLIGDDGLISAVCNLKRLKRMKLDGLKVGDRTLAYIGLYGRTLVRLSLANLDMLTEGGFLSLGLAQGMHALQRFSLTNCRNFTDHTFAIMGRMWTGLKHISVVNCDQVSDTGLALFMQGTASLEVLHLEMCTSITEKGLIPVFASSSGKLREVQVKKCDGISEMGLFIPSHLPGVSSSIKSISITQCPGANNMLLALIGCLCPQATHIDFSGLTGINDEGVLAFLYSGKRPLVSVNLSGCMELSDRVVCAIAEQCGGFLKSFSLDGCKGITDKSLKHMTKHCVVLEDLDVSCCSVTDEGVSPLILEMGVTLSSLNLSGCSCITSNILPLIVDCCHGLLDLNLKHCKGLSQKVIESFESRLWKCTVVSG